MRCKILENIILKKILQIGSQVFSPITLNQLSGC